MNFHNPYITIYFPDSKNKEFKFHKEIIWIFLKNLDNRLGMFKHRVNITLSDSNSTNYNRRFVKSIYEHFIGIDWKEFITKDTVEQKKQLLDIIYNTFMSLATVYDWNKEIIIDTYNKSLNDNYLFNYKTESKQNRLKNSEGYINLQIDGNIATINATITKKHTNETTTIRLLRTDEDNISWSREIKDYSWFDNSHFGLKLLKGEIWVTVNVETNEIEEIFNPKNKTLTQLEIYLTKLKTLPSWCID